MHLLGPWAFLQTKRQLSLPFHILRLVKYPYPLKVILVTSSGVRALVQFEVVPNLT